MKESAFLTLNSGGFARIHCASWGPEDGSPLVCVHGLTGSSADFKFVGEYLGARGYLVHALDMPGRGKSAFLSNPNDYSYRQYAHDLTAFLAHIGCSSPQSCDWLGVSMGGLLGIALGAIPGTPIRRLVLSDVGPEVPQEALDHISTFLQFPVVYENFGEAVAAFKKAIGTGFYRGPMTEEQWEYLARTHLTQREDGTFVRNFDPLIAQVFDSEPTGAVDLWQAWNLITQPVLALRGELSTLFPERLAKKMIETKQGAPMTLETIPECGHVPSLYPDSQIEIIGKWLQANPL